MKTTALALVMLLCGAATAAPGDLPPILKAIETEGSFAFSDGASIYQFFKSGRFRLEPMGVSGRTIEGTWQAPEPSQFTVVGKWAWVNGVSADNDFRKMKLHVNRTPGEAQRARNTTVKLHPVYFVIDELTRISADDYQKATKAPAR